MFAPKKIYDKSKNVYHVIDEYKFEDGEISFNGYINSGRKKPKYMTLQVCDMNIFEFYGGGVRTMRRVSNEVRNNIYKEWFLKHGDKISDDDVFVSWGEYYGKRYKEIMTPQDD